MAATKHSEKVPKAMAEKFASITALTDEFAQQHLNEEYAQLIRYATAALCRKRPSPLAKGQAKSWACGITHAIGLVNFLQDPDFEPYISAKDLYKAFGVGQSTGQGKSKQVRDIFDTYQMDLHWTLPSLMQNNPLNSLMQIGGMIVDHPQLPAELQALLQEGSITIMPSSPPQSATKTKSAKKTAKPKPAPGSPKALYVLEVMIIGGPVMESFVKENPQMIRTIAIKGSQTLQDLHQIIFQAFDRFDAHMYDFQVRGEGPGDPDSERYGLRVLDDPELEGYVETTTIASLGLQEQDVFSYQFDYGDDWWHRIEVLEVQPKTPRGKYPKITERIGASPPQYPDWDEEG